MPTQPLSQLVRRLRTALDADSLAGASDVDLLTHFRRDRDPAAFEALVHRHGPRVLAACRRVLTDPADVDDACQAAFLVLLRNPTAVRDGRALAGWLAGVAHRVSLKALARRQRRDQVEARARFRSSTSPDLSWREACAILHEELDRLPDRQRLPLILCYLEGLSRDEAAARLGRSVNTIKKALEAGRAKLRQRLIRRGVTLSAGLLAAAAGPVVGESAHDLMTPIIGDTVRPAVAELARAVQIGSRLRTVGVGLAAAVLAVGIGLGFQGGPKPGPVAGQDAPPKAAPPKAVPPKDAAKVERVTISGTVVNADGKPVSNASLSLAGWTVDPLKATDAKRLGMSGDGGRFTFDLPKDEYVKVAQPQLIASAANYGLTIHPLDGAGAKDVTVKLADEFTLTGGVLDQRKQPVDGARVRLVAVWLPDKDDADAALKQLNKVGWAAMSGPAPADPLVRRARLGLDPALGFSASVRTNGKGQFNLRGLGPDQFALLVIDSPDVATFELAVLTRRGDGKNIVLPEKAADARNPGSVTLHLNSFYHIAIMARGVQGRVTDRETGEAIKHAIVRSPDGPAHLAAVTNASGTFHIDRLADLPLRLIATPPGESPYFPLTQPVHGPILKGDLAWADFRLTKGVWLSGRVVEARTNKPLAGARVVYYPHRENKSPSATVEWDPPYRERVTESVRSEIETAADGRFRILTAAGRGWLLVNGPFRVLSAEERDIQGDVADRTPSRELPVGRGRSEFLFQLKAVAAVNVNPDKPADVTITLEPGIQPEVRFVDPDGKPLAGVLTRDARLVKTGPPKPLAEKVQAIALSNPERPAPLVVFHPATGLGAAYLPRKGDAGPWTVTLKPTATVTARLVRRDGKPIANESVYIHANQGDIPLSPIPMEVKTDKDGRLKVTGVIGDAEYLLWCLELKDVQGGSRSRTFTAKPGEVKDLGELRPEP